MNIIPQWLNNAEEDGDRLAGCKRRIGSTRTEAIVNEERNAKEEYNSTSSGLHQWKAR
jgi:hypothetical protein